MVFSPKNYLVLHSISKSIIYCSMSREWNTMQSMCHGKKLIRIWKHVLTKMPKNKILYLTHPTPHTA